MTTEPKTGLALMREPFKENQISKLPKPSKEQTAEVKADFRKGIRCTICGGWHHRDVVHLDYVGHAALTGRLLECDPEWDWEPLSVDERGLPVFDGFGGMWIKLTVCGVTRLGYGDAQGKSGGNAIKEVIGDALRNAAMRFGAALDLWHKGGDLHADDPDTGDNPHENRQTPPPRDPAKIRNGLLDAVAKRASEADLIALQNEAKFDAAWNWLMETDADKGAEVTAAINAKLATFGGADGEGS